MSYPQKEFRYYDRELLELAHAKASKWMWPDEGDIDFKTDAQVAQAKTLRGILAPLLRDVANSGRSPFQIRQISELLPNVNIRGLILQRQGDRGTPAAVEQAAGALVMERIYGHRDAPYALYPNQHYIDTAITYGEALIARMYELLEAGTNPLAMSAEDLLPGHDSGAPREESTETQAQADSLEPV
jgi:hypothetical protein